MAEQKESTEEGFKMMDAKAQQKRDSIIGELYNDISSSDDEEEEKQEQQAQITTSASLAAASKKKDNIINKLLPTKKEANNSAATSSDNNSKTNGDEMSNPFKRQHTQAQASEALKELYGEDYEDPIGLEDSEQVQRSRLRDKLSAKFSTWFSRKGNKENGNNDQSDTSVSTSDDAIEQESAMDAVKKKIVSVAQEIDAKDIVSKVEEGAADLMVQMGIDEPLQVTEFGMANPFRTGLSDFLAQEDAKEQQLQELEEAKEKVYLDDDNDSLDKSEQLLKQADDLISKPGDKDAAGLQQLQDQPSNDEFKFTIDADDDSDEEDDAASSGDVKAETTQKQQQEEVAQEEFVDSDEDVAEVDNGVGTQNEQEESNEQEHKKEDSHLVEESKDGEDNLQSIVEEAKNEENPYSIDKLPMNKGDQVLLKDFKLLQTRKEVKNPSALRSMVSQVKEERLLTIHQGHLISLKRMSSMNIAAKSLGRFFAAKIPDSQQEIIAQDDRGLIKGKSDISRLYKIDVVGKGRAIMSGFQSEIQLILHFVNKSRQPTGLPDLKRYNLRSDEPGTKEFLAQLQKEAKQKSSYYK